LASQEVSQGTPICFTEHKSPLERSTHQVYMLTRLSSVFYHHNTYSQLPGCRYQAFLVLVEEMSYILPASHCPHKALGCSGRITNDLVEVNSLTPLSSVRLCLTYLHARENLHVRCSWDLGASRYSSAAAARVTTQR
jgi:hypothetical protein